jgi:hypothetical protein
MGWEAISGLATAGAALVALAVYLGAVSQTKRRQAEQVSAWLELVRDGDREDLFDAVIENRSDQPVYGVYAHESREGLTRPGEWFFVYDVLPPGAAEREPTDLRMAFPGMDAYRLLDFQFRDAAGRRWTRTNGRLKRQHVCRRNRKPT